MAPCPDCGGTGFFRRDVPVNHPLFGKLIRCENQVHAADRVRRLASISGLHETDMTRTLSDIKPIKGNQAMLAAARHMIDDPRGWLYLHGGPGNAKSEILIAIVNDVNAAGRGPAMYVKFSHLVAWMREAFSERDYRNKKAAAGIDSKDWQNLGYLDRFEKIKAIRVLAIDELDKARLTEFTEEFRFDFLDERYRSAIQGESATIFASQSPPDLLPEPIRSRIEDGRFKIVHNTAGDARPEMGW